MLLEVKGKLHTWVLLALLGLQRILVILAHHTADERGRRGRRCTVGREIERLGEGQDVRVVKRVRERLGTGDTLLEHLGHHAFCIGHAAKAECIHRIVEQTRIVDKARNGRCLADIRLEIFRLERVRRLLRRDLLPLRQIVGNGEIG